MIDQTPPYLALGALIAFLFQLSAVAPSLLVRVTKGVVVTKAVDEVSALLRIVVSQILKFIFFLIQMVGVAHDARYCTPY